MDQKEFIRSLEGDTPAEGFTELQLALWHSGKGNWEDAHRIVQKHEGQKDFDRLHAYLHRVEGDEGNANYWYRRSNSFMPEKSLQEEYDLLLKMWLE